MSGRFTIAANPARSQRHKSGSGPAPSHARTPTIAASAATALQLWADHAGAWARGEHIEALPHVGSLQPPGTPREAFVFFIGRAKHRDLAAATALQSRVDCSH